MLDIIFLYEAFALIAFITLIASLIDKHIKRHSLKSQQARAPITRRAVIIYAQPATHKSVNTHSVVTSKKYVAADMLITRNYFFPAARSFHSYSAAFPFPRFQPLDPNEYFTRSYVRSLDTRPRGPLYFSDDLFRKVFRFLKPLHTAN